MKYDYEELKKKVELCKNTNLSDIDIDEIPDIKEVKISKKKSSRERILDFLKEVNNPYVFKSNGRLVQISFANSDKTASECLSNVLKNMYK